MTAKPAPRVSDLSLSMSDKTRLRKANITTVAELKAAIEDDTIRVRLRPCGDDTIVKFKNAIIAHENGERPPFDWKTLLLPGIVAGLFTLLVALIPYLAGIPLSSLFDWSSEPVPPRGAIAPLPQISPGIVWFFAHTGLQFRCQRSQHP